MPFRLFILLVILIAHAGAAPAPLRVAVVPSTRRSFRAEGMSSFVRGALIRRLEASDRFIVVERERVEQVLRELSFSNSGVVAATPAGKLGQLLDVEKLILVDVQRIASNYSATVRVVDVATGQVQRVEQQELGASLDQARAPVEDLGRRLVATASLLRPVEMVDLPAGTFPMGSADGLKDEGPVHKVQVHAFRMDRYEVTRIAFQEFLVASGRRHAVDLTDPELPVTNATWAEASAFCQSRGKRLPTEAEWEYAARGSEGRAYPWGDQPPDDSRARFGASSPVSVYTPNSGATPAGIMHLAGNVAEWVHDWWAPDYYTMGATVEPSGPPAGDYRVVRGGSFASTPSELRAAARAYHNPDRGAADIGFRCVGAACPAVPDTTE